MHLLSGLSEEQAAERLRLEGRNELPSEGRRSFLRILIDVVREPMLALLIAAGLIYLALGDVHEALILVAFAGLSILITVVQETRTERAIAALRDLSSPRALVIRDGERKRVAGQDVVRGDVMVLGEGDRVPADGWIAENDGLAIDESLLTGESVAVRKASAGLSAPAVMLRPGGDDLPCVYSGTLVVRGKALCVVTATGLSSEIGKIGRLELFVFAEIGRRLEVAQQEVRIDRRQQFSQGRSNSSRSAGSQCALRSRSIRNDRERVADADAALDLLRAELRPGDVVLVKGDMYTGRDAVHAHLMKNPPPVSLQGQVLYHCGPVMVKEGDRWVCKAAGPTTSSRATARTRSGCS